MYYSVLLTVSFITVINTFFTEAISTNYLNSSHGRDGIVFKYVNIQTSKIAIKIVTVLLLLLFVFRRVLKVPLVRQAKLAQMEQT